MRRSLEYSSIITGLLFLGKPIIIGEGWLASANINRHIKNQSSPLFQWAREKNNEMLKESDEW
jgi:hypothetical protein